MARRASPGITCDCANDEKRLRIARFYYADGQGPIEVVALVCDEHAVDLANAGWEVAQMDEEEAA